MKGSWKIGTVAGIGIYLHFTFLVLLAWVGLSSFLQRQHWEDGVSGVGFILALFTIIVLHELGHALTAKHFGIRTRDITLLPIGGVARLERIPEEPKQELLVALAGPAVNVALALVFLALCLLAGVSLTSPGPLDSFDAHILARLTWVNVSLAAFNLLPAFPMDGGRVLRALLAMRMNHVKATKVAAGVGKGMALVFGFLGLFINPFLVLIALFVWAGASQEAGEAQMKSALSGLPVGRVMMTEFHALKPDDALALAVKHVLSGSQHEFPVVENGRVVGILTHADILRELAGNGQLTKVREVMRRDFQAAHFDEMVANALARLSEEDCRTMPVICNQTLVGLLTYENLGEYLTIQAALNDPKPRHSGQTRLAPI